MAKDGAEVWGTQEMHQTDVVPIRFPSAIMVHVTLPPMTLPPRPLKK